MFIDSHCHITSDELYPRIEEIIEQAKAANIQYMVNICTDKSTLERGLNLAKLYPFIKNTGATTPHDVEKLGKSDFLAFETAARSKELIAIGETGLDYYYEHSAKELQKNYLIQYFSLALELELPIVIHCREAFADLFTIADQHYPSKKLILHCFTGTMEEALEVVRRGWYISFSGILTFKKSQWLRDVFTKMSHEQVLMETDAPYLAPGKYRGKTNQPAYITQTYECAAQLWGLELNEFAKKIYDNFSRCFAL